MSKYFFEFSGYAPAQTVIEVEANDPYSAEEAAWRSLYDSDCVWENKLPDPNSIICRQIESK